MSGLLSSAKGKIVNVESVRTGSQTTTTSTTWKVGLTHTYTKKNPKNSVLVLAHCHTECDGSIRGAVGLDLSTLHFNGLPDFLTIAGAQNYENEQNASFHAVDESESANVVAQLRFRVHSGSGTFKFNHSSSASSSGLIFIEFERV